MPFQLVDTTYEAPLRLVVAGWGNEKVGKTSFALTMPGPIYLYNFDYGYRPVVASAEGKELYVASYVLPDQFSVSSYKAVMASFQKDWADGIASAAERGGSVVVDTASQLWTVIGQCMTGEVREDRAEENEVRAAEGKRQAQDSRLDYRKANAMMDSILKRPLTVVGQDKVNVMYIQRASPIYEGSSDTGRTKMHGFSTTGNIVEMLLYFGIDEPKDKMGQPLPSKYFARIDFSRYLGATLRGVRIDNPTWDKVTALVS